MWLYASFFWSLEEGKRKVLQVKLLELVVVGTVEGSSLTIHFSSSLDILQAACNVFGQGKNKVGHGSLHSYCSQPSQVQAFWKMDGWIIIDFYQM